MPMLDVIVSARAVKQIRKVPSHVVSKLKLWVDLLKAEGIDNTRKIPGFRDEPLRGKRKGQRSIRLSRAYRAIYTIGEEGEVQIVTIEEVTKHDY